MAAENNHLYVRMLGSFQIFWNQEPLNLSIGSATKIMQFLQLILLRGEKGISREQLIKYLFEGYELSDPANSLRVTHYRLKKLLADSSLPKCDYIQIKKRCYYWTDQIPLTTDTGEFMSLLEKARSAKSAEEKEEFQKAACRLYKGDLLPLLGAEEWVINEGSSFKKAYSNTLKELLAAMKRQGEYKEILELSDQASRIYPYEEWQLYQIDCLMAMGQYNEALEIYNTTSRLYMNDLGITPSKKMLELYQMMSGKVQGNTENIEDIRIQIQEQSMDTGAFYCNLLSFVDSCRILNRIAERSDKSMSLMLCTLREYEGDVRKRQNKIEKEMTSLKATIQKSLRKGDFFTKYSPCQFLIFLIGATGDKTDIVTERIQKRFFQENPQANASLQFSMTSVHEVEKQHPNL